jgi:hypothetical protein
MRVFGPLPAAKIAYNSLPWHSSLPFGNLNPLVGLRRNSSCEAAPKRYGGERRSRALFSYFDFTTRNI